MKYLIKGELALKLGDGNLLPCLYDLRIGAVLSDEIMSLLTGQIGSPPCLEASTPHQLFPAITHPHWLQKSL